MTNILKNNKGSTSIFQKAMVLLLTFLLVFAFLPIKAEAAGTVSYTRSRPSGEYQHFRVTSGDCAGAWGFCGDIFHAAPPTSGTGTSSAVSNSDAVARVMYYWLIVKGWQNVNLTAASGQGSMSYGAALHYTICWARLKGGFSPAATFGGHTATETNFKNSFMGSKDGTNNNYKKVKAMYTEAINAVGAAPASFQVFFIDVPNKNQQDAFVFRIAANVKVVKRINNANVTQNNPLYSLSGIQFGLYPSAAAAQSNTGAVAYLTTNASGETATVSVNPGTYYLVEFPSSNGVVVPNQLKAVNGGLAVPILGGGGVINVSDNAPTNFYNANYRYANASELPPEVMATLPSSTSYPDGSVATPSEPSLTEVTVDDVVYTFDGWDAQSKNISGSDVVFVGTWTIDTPDDINEDFEALVVVYQYENADDLPQEVLDTLPQDLDEDGEVNMYEAGDTVEPLSPTQTEVTVDDETYVFSGWDKESDTFDDANIVFTGSWQIQRSSMSGSSEEPIREEPQEKNEDMPPIDMMTNEPEQNIGE